MNRYPRLGARQNEYNISSTEGVSETHTTSEAREVYTLHYRYTLDFLCKTGLFWHILDLCTLETIVPLKGSVSERESLMSFLHRESND